MKKILKKLKKLQSSAWFLIGANFVTVFGVLFLNWGLVDVLLIYFLESLVIGFYNILKMMGLEMEVDKEFPAFSKVYNWGIKTFFSTVFAVHFGAMTMLLGGTVYLFTSLSMMFSDVKIDIFKVIAAAWPAILSLFISHGYSFFKNYYRGEEYKKATILRLMGQPYIRLFGLLIILFVAGMLIVGGALLYKSGVIKFKAETMGSFSFLFKVVFTCIFIALKTVVDLIGHLRERKKFGGI
ncbi:MAG: hypothetical protein GY754_18855 [bacterium]|nr:hypothetical protein [bacterium]